MVIKNVLKEVCVILSYGLVMWGIVKLVKGDNKKIEKKSKTDKTDKRIKSFKNMLKSKEPMEPSRKLGSKLIFCPSPIDPIRSLKAMFEGGSKSNNISLYKDRPGGMEITNKYYKVSKGGIQKTQEGPSPTTRKPQCGSN